MPELDANLSEFEIERIKTECTKELEAIIEGEDVKGYLASLTRLGNIWLELVKKYDPEASVEAGYTQEFNELYKLFPDFFNDQKLRGFFCKYYKAVIGSMSNAITLNTFEEKYYEALCFSSALIGMLEAEGGDIFNEAIDTYDDFVVWKNYIFMLSDQREE